MKTLNDLHMDAVLLHGLLEGLDAMQHDDDATYGNARVASGVIAARLALQLANDIERQEAAQRKSVQRTTQGAKS